MFACLNQYFYLEFRPPQRMATGGFQESIGYISKIQEQQITRWMNIYQALISVHLLISCSFSEGHSWSLLVPWFLKTSFIMVYPQETQLSKKRGLCGCFRLLIWDKTPGGENWLWGSQSSCCGYSALVVIFDFVHSCVQTCVQQTLHT